MIHGRLLINYSRSQEILKDKSCTECLHASTEQGVEGFPETTAHSADEKSSSPTDEGVPGPEEELKGIEEGHLRYSH